LHSINILSVSWMVQAYDSFFHRLKTVFTAVLAEKINPSNNSNCTPLCRVNLYIIWPTCARVNSADGHNKDDRVKRSLVRRQTAAAVWRRHRKKSSTVQSSANLLRCGELPFQMDCDVRGDRTVCDNICATAYKMFCFLKIITFCILKKLTTFKKRKPHLKDHSVSSCHSAKLWSHFEALRTKHFVACRLVGMSMLILLSLFRLSLNLNSVESLSKTCSFIQHRSLFSL